jgi:hypothetical protein
MVKATRTVRTNPPVSVTFDSGHWTIDAMMEINISNEFQKICSNNNTYQPRAAFDRLLTESRIRQ